MTDALAVTTYLMVSGPRTSIVHMASNNPPKSAVDTGLYSGI